MIYYHKELRIFFYYFSWITLCFLNRKNYTCLMDRPALLNKTAQYINLHEINANKIVWLILCNAEIKISGVVMAFSFQKTNIFHMKFNYINIIKTDFTNYFNNCTAYEIQNSASCVFCEYYIFSLISLNTTRHTIHNTNVASLYVYYTNPSSHTQRH